MRPSPRFAGLAALLGLALSCTACGEELVVRLGTRVYPEGGIARRVEILGREGDGSLPEQADWLVAHAGVHLANREAWGKVEEAPGRIAAEGFFPKVEDLPPTLAHRTQGYLVTDHAKASLRIDDLVVLKRWAYREEIGDPYGPSEVGAALDSLIGITSQALREELRRTFGDRFDPSPAEAFLRGEGRGLLEELVPILRKKRGAEDQRQAWADVLTRHGVPVSDSADYLFSNDQVELLSSWCRGRVARALSTPERPLRAEDLSFWPAGDDADEQSKAIAGHLSGGEEELSRKLEPILGILSGYYGEAGGPRFRFETRLLLPGRLLRTNGTPEREGMVWVFRDEDLAEKERLLEAESVELNDEILRALGARRDLDAVRLLELTDLLAVRDTEGALRRLLLTAVHRGGLKSLRDLRGVPEEVQPLARELADLLDPAIETQPALF